ncbi:hypothetical protein BGZ80_004205 [Entomortierella chlamydospora]|uniref:ABC1 atypical kinase-like domain-containing protein n=1 Tax=Entomortierella chlamydospora TaxID=101097 RepID=A0A9P6N0I1_9FUNG|nr:hypothetical protein BGZ80_004205 [Entomortierella chlamydospora]
MTVPLLQRLFTYKAVRTVTVVSATATGLYLIDTHKNAKAFQRTARLAWNGTLRALYDDASSVDYSIVEQIIRKELGKEISEVFSSFSRIPVAAASIAQVHKARLHDGTVVAVKVQKPEIQYQIEWDLLAYRLLLKVYEYMFDLPMSFAVDYTTKHLRQETDFLNEVRNSEMCNAFLQTDSKLKSVAHVPKVFKELSTKQVMIAEWVDGCRATDKAAIHDMGLSVKKVMESVVDVFAHQIFVSGFVHCDPHPGNILVRKHPEDPRKHQLLLLDHGLYVRESEEFRKQYCLFWKSLFLLDKQAIQDICDQWGVGDSQMFANVTLLRPYNTERSPSITPSSNTSVLDAYELQTKLKSNLKDFLANSELLPKELIFIGRNMTIVRANNKTLGSPVNRINRMARWAVVGLGHDSSYWASSVKAEYLLTTPKDVSGQNRAIGKKDQQPLGFWKTLAVMLQTRWNSWLFEVVLAFMSLAYHTAQLRSYFDRTVLGRKSDGFEAVMDDALKQRLEQEYGIKVEGDLFDA